MITEVLKQRRSIRKFKQEPIDGVLLEEFIDCARLASSGANLQPIKYLYANSKQMCGKIFPLTKWAAYLKDGAPRENERPTAYIAILNDSAIRKEGWELDAGAAAMSIIIAAQSKGIASCWLGAIDREALSSLFGLKEEIKISSIIALGYPHEKSQAVPCGGDIKYFKDESGTLNVPKRSINEVLVNKF